MPSSFRTNKKKRYPETEVLIHQPFTQYPHYINPYCPRFMLLHPRFSMCVADYYTLRRLLSGRRARVVRSIFAEEVCITGVGR